jgi:hypothetical protein
VLLGCIGHVAGLKKQRRRAIKFVYVLDIIG